MRPWMRQGQLGGVDDPPSEVDEIDVNCPRTVPDRANPPEVVLNRMHPAGEVKRIERRRENRHLIEELERGEFGRHVNWLGLNDTTRLHKPRLGQGRKRGNRLFQVFCPRLDIGTEGNEDAFASTRDARRVGYGATWEVRR